MRTWLNHFEFFLVWGLFLATTVYGHVALKFATGQTSQFSYARAGHALLPFWGGSAAIMWIGSTLLWAVIITRTSLQTANAITALRYLLISFAAWLWLGESLSASQIIGLCLITIGVWLCAH